MPPPKTTSDKADKFEKSQEGTKDSGKKSGVPVQPCPLATLKVIVKSFDPKLKPKGKITVEVTGQEEKKVAALDPAVYKKLPAGTYEASASLKDWVLKEKKSATLACGEEKTIELVIDKYELVKVKPDDPPKPTKWYVNLDSDEPQKHGRTVSIEAHINRKIPGVTVYFTIDRDGKNRKNLLADLDASLSAASADTDDQGIARTTLTLSRYGGDKVRVSASLVDKTKPGKGDSKLSQWFETWRKVFYETDCMKRPGSANTYVNLCDTARMSAEYKKRFIEMASVGADTSPAHLRVITENQIDGWANPLRSNTGQPRYLHLVLIDSIVWDMVSQQRTYAMASLSSTQNLPADTNTMDTSDWRDGDVEIDIQRKHPVTNALSWDGWITLASPDTYLQVSAVGDDFRLAINLANAAGLGMGPAFPADVTSVRLRLKLKIWTEGSGLQTGTGSIVVAIRWRERDYSGSTLKDRTLNTMIHEVGHAYGLASTTLPDGTPAGTRTYFQAGYHCHGLSDKCVMWDSNLKQYQFCSYCSDGVRGRDLAALPVSGGNPM